MKKAASSYNSSSKSFNYGARFKYQKQEIFVILKTMVI